MVLVDRADFAIRGDVARIVQVQLVYLFPGHELINLDGALALNRYRAILSELHTWAAGFEPLHLEIRSAVLQDRGVDRARL